MPERTNSDDFFSRRSEPGKQTGKEEESDGGLSQPPLEPHSQLAMRLSISQMTTKNWTFQQDLQTARFLGLRHIGLWRWKYEDIDEQYAADLLEEWRLCPSSISWIGGFTGINGYLLKDVLEESRNVIRYASWVGAPTVVVSTGEKGSHIQNHVVRLVADSLQELGDFAAEFGVQLALMPMSPTTAHGWTFVTSMRKCREVIELCDHDHVGICLHSFHLLQERHWKSQLKPLMPAVKLVRLGDSQLVGQTHRQCLPFSGEMNLVGLLDFLESHGYRDLYEIDTWSDDVWQMDEIDPYWNCLRELAANFPSNNGE